MKKYIEREAARNMIEDWSGGFDYIEESVSDAIADLEAIPAADVREVVTCGECKWWTKQKASLQGRCELSGGYPTAGWFCANGKREES